MRKKSEASKEADRIYKRTSPKWKAYIKAYHQTKKSKDYLRNHYLKKNYNITLEEYSQMFLNQNGNCAICGRNQSEFKKNLSVDHCHKTGIVRGLLCGNCNRALGLLSEDCATIQSAIFYLQRQHNG